MAAPTASEVKVAVLVHDVRVTPDPWSAAEPYERFMGRWSHPLAAEVLDWLDPPAGQRWLDVGCGTGAVSEALLTHAAPSTVVGVDPSSAYLAAAAARLDDSRVTVAVGGATDLPVPEASVDHVVSGLVLNFVPDGEAALREMRRVLVPGGSATAYVWDYAEGMQMLRQFWDAAVAEDRAAGVHDEGARFPICREGALPQLLADAGLREVRAEPVTVEMRFDDFDDYWLPFLGGQGSVSGYLATLSPEGKERLRARLEATLPVAADASITLVARAWVASGVHHDPLPSGRRIPMEWG